MVEMNVFESELLSVDGMTRDVKVFRFSTPDDFSFQAGEFVMITCATEEKSVKRSYSIASSPGQKGSIDLGIKLVEGGICSEYFKTLEVGAKVEMRGCFGKFTLASRENDVAFIAGGIGIAPFIGMMQDLNEQGFNGKIILIFGFRYEDDVLYVDEIKELQEKYGNIERYDILSSPRDPDYAGEKGLVQVLINKHLSDGFDGDYYICGSTPMIRDVRKFLLDKGIPKEKIRVEGFG